MRYKNIEIIRNQTDKGILGVRYFKLNKYPEIPFSENDIYIITNSGDRYDLLAQQYYNNINYWWVIPTSNPEIGFDSIYPPPGSQLRIPPLSQVITNYIKLNSL